MFDAPPTPLTGRTMTRAIYYWHQSFERYWARQRRFAEESRRRADIAIAAARERIAARKEKAS